MDQTYNRTYTAKQSPQRSNVNETYNRSPNPNQTYVTTPRRGRSPNPNQTYETNPRRGNPNQTYDKSPQVNRTYNRSSGRKDNKTYAVESDDSSSFDFVQEDDYSPESTTPTFESSESEAVDSFSKFGAPNQQSTPKRNMNLLQEFDVLGPIMKRLDHSMRANLGQTFTKSPGEKHLTPSDRTWAIFVDDMNNEQGKRSKSTPKRPTTTPQYYVNTPTRASPPVEARKNKMVSRKLDFGNASVDNQLYFSNRMSVTRTEPNGHSITFTRSKSGPDVSVLKNHDC